MGLLGWIMVVLGGFAVAFFILANGAASISAALGGPLIIGVFLLGLILVSAFAWRRRRNRTKL